jgi:hypothetical protein
MLKKVSALEAIKCMETLSPKASKRNAAVLTPAG